MRITEKNLVAVIDVHSDSSGTAAFIKNYADKGRIVVEGNTGLRSIIFADGDRGSVICLSSATPQCVRKRFKELGFIII